ncbi:predicted protein [Histoplasma capsulatum G186AR]|uniref:Uncharacterized protein n=1 Tax=Ajellomyces capsulatus (strain G186AR / H82 / ATCC MYA-2454 / RMSCC 2432) TaxID=447093 RepID=C0NXI5_AJECG|nr:uncharacterized protein HCBG_08177 [Histoplasma capsulatum G186AR]EEH04051.1 predicted protein [Histoplasma capsulatum G186AR]
MSSLELVIVVLVVEPSAVRRSQRISSNLAAGCDWAEPHTMLQENSPRVYLRIPSWKIFPVLQPAWVTSSERLSKQQPKLNIKIPSRQTSTTDFWSISSSCTSIVHFHNNPRHSPQRLFLSSPTDFDRLARHKNANESTTLTFHLVDLLNYRRIISMGYGGWPK